MLMQGENKLKILREAAAKFAAVAAFSSTEPGPLSGLSIINHDYLFDFDQAYTWTRRLEELQPSNGNKLNLAEAAMTVDKFDECTSIAKEMDESKLEGEHAMFRRLLLMSCAWGAGNRAMARTAAEAFVEKAASAKPNGWTTNGDRAYLKDAEEFSLGREQWIELYQAVQNGDSKAITAAAQGLAKLAVQ